MALISLETLPDSWQPDALGGHVALTYQGFDGSIASVEPASPGRSLRPPGAVQEGSDPSGAGAVNFAAGDFYSASVELVLSHDWDGDGADEIAVRTSRFAHEEDGQAAIRLWTLRNGEVALYAAQPDVVVTAVEDMDEDGRVDLITYAPFFSWAPGALSDNLAYGPPLLVHALPDGRFTRDDPVAQRFTDCSCHGLWTRERLSSHLDAGWDGDSNWSEAVACARLGGMDDESILETMRRMCAALTPPIPSYSICSRPAAIRDFLHARRDTPPDHLNASADSRETSSKLDRQR